MFTNFPQQQQHSEPLFSEPSQKNTPKIFFGYDSLIVPVLKQFIFKLKKKIQLRNFKNFSKNDFDIIKDPSSFYYDQSKIRSLKFNFFGLKSVLPKIPIINPFEGYKVIWDMTHLILLLFIFFWIPIEIGFRSKLPSTAMLAIILFFFVDIFINFNTAYYENGFLNFNRTTIRAHYLHFSFWVDSISTFIFFLDFLVISESNQIRIAFGFMKLVFYLRVRKMEKIYDKMIEIFKLRHTSLLDLINLLSFSFFILHVFACAWFLIAVTYVEKYDSETWLFKLPGLNDETDVVKYIYCLYWSTVTIMTVGYGDISASNKFEVVFSIITIFFGCVLFGYIINTVGMIIGEINKEKSLFKFFL